jgi:beta-phosphoglucomutase-like phosphatase (HAD superfamily)
MLGLPATIRACLFDLEGVLTDSALLHAWAWSEVFDEFLLRLNEKTGWRFIPFDRGGDYRDYLEGRPRLEGVHAFLGSRGIRPEDELTHLIHAHGVDEVVLAYSDLKHETVMHKASIVLAAGSDFRLLGPKTWRCSSAARPARRSHSTRRRSSLGSSQRGSAANC